MKQTIDNCVRSRHKRSSGVKDSRDLCAGLVRRHVWHHVAKQRVYWLAMIKELGRHGYDLSAGTLYRLLHGLERRGLLTKVEQRSGSTQRRLYSITAYGRRALAAAKTRGRELFGKLFEDRRISAK